MENFHLEPLNYFSTPGFAFDAALKYSGVKLELMDNEAMYGMIEKGIRGGVSQISLREAVANNELMDDYKVEDPLVYLIYLDCTNLYGTVMVEKLPTHGFRWMEESEWEKLVRKRKLWYLFTAIAAAVNIGGHSWNIFLKTIQS